MDQVDAAVCVADRIGDDLDDDALLGEGEHLAEVGDELGFVEEAADELGVVAQLGAQDLGHVDGAELGVAHPPELAHAPHGQPVHKFIFTHPLDGWVDLVLHPLVLVLSA